MTPHMQEYSEVRKDLKARQVARIMRAREIEEQRAVAAAVIFVAALPFIVRLVCHGIVWLDRVLTQIGL